MAVPSCKPFLLLLMKAIRVFPLYSVLHLIKHKNQLSFTTLLKRRYVSSKENDHFKAHKAALRIHRIPQMMAYLKGDVAITRKNSGTFPICTKNAVAFLLDNQFP